MVWSACWDVCRASRNNSQDVNEVQLKADRLTHRIPRKSTSLGHASVLKDFLCAIRVVQLVAASGQESQSTYSKRMKPLKTARPP